MANPQSDIKVRIKPNPSIIEPPLFRIIYINDEVTSMGFVVSSLIDFFSYSEETAAGITDNIHSTGSAVVAVLPYEIAETRGIEVTIAARAQGFPLMIKVEADV